MDNPIVEYSMSQEQVFQPIDILHHEILTNEDTHIEDTTEYVQESPTLKINTNTQRAVNQYTSNSYGSNLRGIVKIHNGSHIDAYIQAIGAITNIKQLIIVVQNDDSDSNSDYAANAVKLELLKFLEINNPLSFSLQPLIDALEKIDGFEGTEITPTEFFSMFPIRIFGRLWNTKSNIEISSNKEDAHAIILSNQNLCKICDTNSSTVCVSCILVLLTD
jgi:hypothetical protein